MLREVSNYAIGISIGNSSACVAVIQQNKPESIANQHGNRITPFRISFMNDGVLVGETAIPWRDPAMFVGGVSRLLGRKHSDRVSQEFMQKSSLVIEPNQNDRPVILIRRPDNPKQFSAQQITAVVLASLRKTAENYLGEKVEQAVIAVPPYFCDRQRQAMKDAATMAGLRVLRIINEPTAAALAYQIDKKPEQQNILVFDFGGSSCCATLESVEDGILEVKGFATDDYNAGDAIDQILAEFCAQHFFEKTNISVRQNPKAIGRLRMKCEHAKQALSSSLYTDIEVEELSKGHDFSLRITRAKFEELTLPVLKRAVALVQKVLDDSSTNRNQIGEVVLTGGSCRIPKVLELLREQFPRQTIFNFSIDSELIIASGAAVIANTLLNPPRQPIFNCCFNVVVLSIGVETTEGAMSVILPRNTMLPAIRTSTFTTCCPQQTQALISIYEGERALAKDNLLIGRFLLTDLPAAPQGQLVIQIQVSIDHQDILLVAASEVYSGHHAAFLVNANNNQHILTRGQVEKNISQREKNIRGDEILNSQRTSRVVRGWFEQANKFLRVSMGQTLEEVESQKQMGMHGIVESFYRQPIDNLSQQQADFIHNRMVNLQYKISKLKNNSQLQTIKTELERIFAQVTRQRHQNNRNNNNLTVEEID